MMIIIAATVHDTSSAPECLITILCCIRLVSVFLSYTHSTSANYLITLIVIMIVFVNVLEHFLLFSNNFTQLGDCYLHQVSHCEIASYLITLVQIVQDKMFTVIVECVFVLLKQLIQ